MITTVWLDVCNERRTNTRKQTAKNNSKKGKKKKWKRKSTKIANAKCNTWDKNWKKKLFWTFYAMEQHVCDCDEEMFIFFNFLSCCEKVVNLFTWSILSVSMYFVRISFIYCSIAIGKTIIMLAVQHNKRKTFYLFCERTFQIIQDYIFILYLYYINKQKCLEEVS